MLVFCEQKGSLYCIKDYLILDFSGFIMTCNLYSSMHSGGLNAIVNAAKGGDNNFYEWVSCEWSKYKGDQKALVSFITHFIRGWKKRRGLADAAAAESSVAVVVCRPPRPKTHCIKLRNRNRQKEEISEPKDTAVQRWVQSQGLGWLRCEALKGAETASREFIWIEVKGQTAINHAVSWGLSSSIQREDERTRPDRGVLKAPHHVCLIWQIEGLGAKLPFWSRQIYKHIFP